MIRIARAILPAAAIVVLLAGSAQAGQWVVLDSSVPGLSPGSEVPSDGKLDLPDGTAVSLVDQSGSMVTLKGPFSGVPAAPQAGGDGRIAASLASLLRSNTDDAKSVGAVRAAGEAPASLADVLAIDPTRAGGLHCLYDVSDAALARAPTSPTTPVSIVATETGETAKVEWPGNATRQPWPSAVPLVDGSTYLLERAGESQAPVFTLKVLSGQATTDLARAAEMADAGCTRQARALVAVATKTATSAPVPSSTAEPQP
jgi:hypothetical protein